MRRLDSASSRWRATIFSGRGLIGVKPHGGRGGAQLRPLVSLLFLVPLVLAPSAGADGAEVLREGQTSGPAWAVFNLTAPEGFGLMVEFREHGHGAATRILHQREDGIIHSFEMIVTDGATRVRLDAGAEGAPGFFAEGGRGKGYWNRLHYVYDRNTTSSVLFYAAGDISDLRYSLTSLGGAAALSASHIGQKTWFFDGSEFHSSDPQVYANSAAGRVTHQSGATAELQVEGALVATAGDPGWREVAYEGGVSIEGGTLPDRIACPCQFSHLSGADAAGPGSYVIRLDSRGYEARYGGGIFAGADITWN